MSVADSSFAQYSIYGYESKSFVLAYYLWKLCIMVFSHLVDLVSVQWHMDTHCNGGPVTTTVYPACSTVSVNMCVFIKNSLTGIPTVK
jgi:hypothetical protein